MLVRDVRNATARAADLTVSALLTGRAAGVRRARYVGVLATSRLNVSTLANIGRVWGGRDRATARHLIGQGEALIAGADPAALELLSKILSRLKVEALPMARPVQTGPRFTLKTLRKRLVITEAKANALRAQITALEEAQP